MTGGNALQEHYKKALEVPLTISSLISFNTPSSVSTFFAFDRAGLSVTGCGFDIL
jgi:hypothetical protein